MIEDPSDSADGSSITYFRPGETAGTLDLFAEQLRMDSVALSTGPALGMASTASLGLGWFGIDEDDDNDPKLCDEEGWTRSGNQLADVQRCVIARVDPDGE